MRRRTAYSKQMRSKFLLSSLLLLIIIVISFIFNNININKPGQRFVFITNEEEVEEERGTANEQQRPLPLKQKKSTKEDKNINNINNNEISASTETKNVWIFTSVAADYDGAVLLKQFVNHYRDLGIKAEHFLVVINSKSGFRTKEFDQCALILDSLQIPYYEYCVNHS